MRIKPVLLALPFTFLFLLAANKSFAFQKDDDRSEKSIATDKTPKYNYHEASSLSGIQVRQDKKNGTFILNFDQKLTELGVLHLKNNSGKVVFAKSLEPSLTNFTHTMNVGHLHPGIYSIEVKTSDTTFWKKVKIRK